jgi:ATP-dependent Lhr-like helicase
MKRGLIYSDSFTPIRNLIDSEKIDKSTPRQRVSAKIDTTTSGRWDIVRSLKPINVEEQLNRAFEKVGVLSRETIAPLLDFSWATALEYLRIWEWTGRARRGYFVEGMSGAQYIKDEAYASIVRELAHPSDNLVWIHATDPNQVLGKSIAHIPDKQFINVSGTVVALKNGIPVMVYERYGQILRVFDYGTIHETLKDFKQAFHKQHIYPNMSRIVIKSYPEEAAKSLIEAGFERAILDFVVYR